MSSWENLSAEEIMEMIRAQEAQLQLDEAFARSLSVAPSTPQKNELSDYELCVRIQQQEEEHARQLLELKRRQADLHYEQMRAKEKEDEWKMIAKALREGEDKDFPELGAKPPLAKPVPPVVTPVAIEREALKPVEEICAQLAEQYPSIPLEFIQHVAAEAQGSLEDADTRVFQWYPNEYLAHRQHAVASDVVAEPSSLIKVKITKIKGCTLQDTDSESRSDDPVRKAYLALAGRKGYDAEDLKRAYKWWGQQPPSRPHSKGGGGRGEEQTTLNGLYYQSARWDSEAIATQISQESGALSVLSFLAEQDNAKQALEAKIADLQQQLLASRLEAADMLFVRLNPKLLSLVSRRARQPNRALVVDLHTMHVNEAVDRVRAVLQCAHRAGWLQIKFITGKGKHSANMQAKLGPEIQAYLVENELGRVQDIQLLDGAVHVSLKN